MFLFCRAITVIEEAYNITLLALFLYFGILFAFYGFLVITVSSLLYIKEL